MKTNAPPRDQPGDIIHLPGGEAVRVVESGMTEHVAVIKGVERIVRSAWMHTRPA